MSASTTAARPGTSVSNPPVSNRAPVGLICSVCASRAATSVAADTGRFTQKTHRQLATAVRSPAISGPIERNALEIAARSPTARPCSPGGKAATTTASDAGIITAAPTPWTARAAISASPEGAIPAAADASANTVTPTANSRTGSNMSARRPPTATKAASVRS